ncbi:zinc finger protein 436-like isoform X6 [Leptopilina boulardi]|uniref:zinc finger protein 436-like isoform X6 n=1 Tax=Leptopilina boulardi TaxID=63433 RepID=UPI0021F5A346|nr:zinc finger protein 436-like isoform X6 [Leptopilina boulardi]
MSSLDYLDLCRLCLVKDRVGISIFEDEGDARQVFLKIASCLPVKVSREDKLPKKICDDCMYKLELFYQFWNTTANAEKQLLQWLDDVDMQDKQGYVTEVLNPSLMKQEQQASENRLDENVLQVGTHQNNMGMGMMDNMGLGMPIIISTTNQPMTSVSMDTSGSSVQTIQAVPGTSTQSTHDQISQNQVTNVHHNVDEDSDDDEENESDDECDADDGLPVKEENEDDPNNRTVEPTTFVNVSLPCDEAGPSGLQQQKITEMPEMAMPQIANADNKTGVSIEDGCFIYGNESIEMQPWQIVDFEGCKYYAFLPTEQVSKIMKVEIKENESITAHESAESIQDNNDDDDDDNDDIDDTTEMYLDAEFEKQIKATQQQLKQEIEIDDIDNDDDDDDDDVDYEVDSENLNYEEVVIMHDDEIENNFEELEEEEDEIEEEEEEIEEALSPNLNNVKIKIEDLSNEDPEDVTIIYNQGMKLYVCRKCDFCFTHLDVYQRHMNSTHFEGEEFKCDICDQVFTGLTELKEHANHEHKTKENKENVDASYYNCNFCTYKSTNRSTLNSHVSRKHSSSRKSAKLSNSKNGTQQIELSCDICDFKCPNKRRLKEHLERRHADDYKYECNECGKKFKVKGDMRLHVRFKHKEGPIVCDVCGKTCSNSNSLYVHQKWAHFKPKYECEICHRRMVSQENLDQHILLQHERRESFVCEECGKSFNENHRLKQHMMTHTGDRPYDCHVCGKAFARRTSFRQHLLIHTGKRPYICDICGKAFTQKPGLICHRKSHPGVHPPLPVVHIEHIINDFMKKE